RGTWPASGGFGCAAGGQHPRRRPPPGAGPAVRPYPDHSAGGLPFPGAGHIPDVCCAGTTTTTGRPPGPTPIPAKNDAVFSSTGFSISNGFLARPLRHAISTDWFLDWCRFPGQDFFALLPPWISLKTLSSAWLDLCRLVSPFLGGNPWLRRFYNHQAGRRRP